MTSDYQGDRYAAARSRDLCTDCATPSGKFTRCKSCRERQRKTRIERLYTEKARTYRGIVISIDECPDNDGDVYPDGPIRYFHRFTHRGQIYRCDTGSLRPSHTLAAAKQLIDWMLD